MNTKQGVGSEEGAASAGPAVGDVIFPYRLVRLLGEGSAGRVFEVEHVKIGRRAAMKVLSPDHANRPGSVRRLFQEAKAVNRINHPHIVDVTDVIEATQPGAVNAILMELLEGQSLAQAMLAQGRMPAERIVAILAQVADALAAAHGAYFIHRDLKPENIFLVRRGRQQDVVKVLDFGLAKSFAGGDASTSRSSYHTVEGAFVGTPAYTSPEQASAKAVDHRTDVYSLGVILYELLSGQLPFEGRNFGEFLVKHLTMPVPAIPADRCRTPLERTLALVAYKCLEKNPADRFGSAGDVKAVFERLLRGETVEVEVRRPEARRRRRPRREWALAAAVAMGLLGAGGWLLARQPAPAPVVPGSVKPATVIFSFESDPPGAQVRRQGQSALLGLTPFRQEFPHQEGSLGFEMSLAGHLIDRFQLSAQSDATVRRQLSRQPAPGAEPAPPDTTGAPVTPAGKGSKGGRRPAAAASKGRAYTVDPFAP